MSRPHSAGGTWIFSRFIAPFCRGVDGAALLPN